MTTALHARAGSRIPAPALLPPFVRISVILLACGAASAQAPTLLRDVNLTPAANSASVPTGFVTAGEYTFFTAFDVGTGRELYATQGTPATTRLVADINPGPAYSSPGGLTALGTMLMFFANDGSSGHELWKSDGTAVGTQLVKDIRPGPLGVSAQNVTAVGNTLFFSADNGIHGLELWVSDGTETGTRLVEDIRPGVGSSQPTDLEAFNGLLYFSAFDPTAGRELWRSDGTEPGTFLVADINPGSGSSSPNGKTVLGSELLFFALEPGTGRELWKNDGTGTGTVLVKDIQPGPSSSVSSFFPDGVAPVGGTLYFRANDGATGFELWKSDGTTAGTTLVEDIRPGPVSSAPDRLSDLGGLLVFKADDGVHGTEPWSSDGTAAGTQLVSDIAPGAQSSDPGKVTAAGGVGFFAAFHPLVGTELWRTDGTGPGTSLVEDIFPGPSGSIGALQILDIGGLVLFSADNGTAGFEPWTSDGTSANTVLLEVSVPPPNATIASSPEAPADLMLDLQRATLFVADDGTNGHELWRSDGTQAGTVLVKDIRPQTASSTIMWLTEVDGTAYFAADDGVAGRELWKSDGTTAGTVLVGDLVPGPFSAQPRQLTAVGSKLFFVADQPGREASVWASDGTAAGTMAVGTATSTSAIRELTAVGDTLFFVMEQNRQGREVWKSDGTAAGTVMVKEIVPGRLGSEPTRLVAVGDTLFFQAYDRQQFGRELWKSDGTEAGTVMVKDINPGVFWSRPGSTAGMVAVGDTVYFDAEDGVRGRELWKSDGTAAGTVIVKDISPGGGYAPQPGLQFLTAVGDRVFFQANDGIHGFELWVSDGTEGGTRMVEDIATGGTPTPRSSAPQGLLAVGSRRVYFSALHLASGRELWVSDGTAAGTALVDDLWPGTGSMSRGPNSLLVSGPRLMFRADDRVVGSELWSLLPGAIAQSIGHGCGDALRVPALRATDPVLGQVMQVSVAGSVPSNGALLLGFPIGTPIFAFGCPVYLDLSASLLVLQSFATSGGGFAAGIPIPPVPALTGAELVLQGFLVPQTLVLETTNGVRLTFGT